MRTCKVCGKEEINKGDYCQFCGASMPPENPIPEPEPTPDEPDSEPTITDPDLDLEPELESEPTPTPVASTPVATPATPAPVTTPSYYVYATPIPEPTPLVTTPVAEPKPKKEKGEIDMKKVFTWIFGIIGTLILLVVLVFAFNKLIVPTINAPAATTQNVDQQIADGIKAALAAAGVNNTSGTTTSGQPAATTATNPNSTTQSTVPAATDSTGGTIANQPAATGAIADQKNVGPVILNGESVAKWTEFVIQPGDVVSGDVFIVVSDQVKKSLCDDDAKTADIVEFKKGCIVWSEWAFYVAHNASESEIKNMIADKERQHYTVRHFSWPSDNISK